MTLIVTLPLAVVAHHGQQITIHDEIYDWCFDHAGWGDRRWWMDLPELKAHLDHCVGGTICSDPQACEGEAWGWTCTSWEEIAHVGFRNDDIALLFKLTWGGV